MTSTAPPKRCCHSAWLMTTASSSAGRRALGSTPSRGAEPEHVEVGWPEGDRLEAGGVGAAARADALAPGSGAIASISAVDAGRQGARSVM